MGALQEIDTILTYLEFLVKTQSNFNEYNDKSLKFIKALRNATLHESLVVFLVRLYINEYKKETK